jgi:hypothetical protein
MYPPPPSMGEEEGGGGQKDLVPPPLHPLPPWGGDAFFNCLVIWNLGFNHTLGQGRME